MNITKLFATLLFVALNHTSYAQFLFQPSVSYPITDQPTHLCSGDFNNDGKVDIATSNKYHNSVSVLLGNGAGQLSLSASYPVGTFPQNVSTADFNSDGNADLVTANPQSNNFSLLLGAGNGNFAPAVHFPAGNAPMGVACADFNGDGKMDVVLSLSGTNSVVFLAGNGNGTFQGGLNYPTGGNSPNTMEHGDFNNDGKLDVMVGHYSSPSLAILLNNGTGGFSNLNVITTAGWSGIFVSTVFDINSDGFLDAIESSSVGSVFVYTNNGNGGLMVTAAVNAGFDAHRSHCVADFDQDGFNDIAGCAADLSPNVTISAGDTGAAAFYNYQALTINGGSAFPQHIIDCDLDGDGARDIVVAEAIGSRVVVFLNNIPTQIQVTEAAGTLLVYPNPAREKLFFYESNIKIKQLTNFAGQLIRSTGGSVMDIQNVPKGFYLLRCGKRSQTIIIE